MAADPIGGGTTVFTWLAWWPSVAVTLGAAPALLAEHGATVLALAWIASPPASCHGSFARREPPDA
jgi:hypothetical protein